jgi:hypothetical protein
MTADAATRVETRVVAFDAPPSGNKYTRQHFLDVGDVPGHRLRLFELAREYGGDAQVIEGVVLKAAVIRGTSDLTDMNGLGHSYVEYVLANGDRIHATGYVLCHKLPGSTRLKNLTELTITGAPECFATSGAWSEPRRFRI